LTEVREAKRATAGFILSLIAGIIDAITALIIIGFGSFLVEIESYFGISQIVGFAVTTVGAIGLGLAILVIIGAALIYMPGYEIIGGILVLVFSLISWFFTRGGLYIGLILGILGDLLGITKK
jgi:hypothetical protein